MKKILFTFLLLSQISLFSYADTVKKSPINYYNKHIIFLVDQTPDVQNHQDMRKIYKDICDLLHNKKFSYGSGMYPSNFVFNPETDEISLYAFGLYGRYGSNFTPYAQIGNACLRNDSPNDVSNKIVDALIHERSSFRKSGAKDLNDFLENHMFPLFNKKDPLCANISKYSGITLSHFVYPCILDKLDSSMPTKEYYIIIVTNYQSGLTGNGDAQDTERLKDLVHHLDVYKNNFLSKINYLNETFYQIKNLKLSIRDTQKDPIIQGADLRLLSLENTNVRIASNMIVQETDYNKTTYEVNKIEIPFYHKEEILTVDSLVLEVGDKDETVYKKKLDLNCDNNKTYYVESQEIDLKKVFSVGDKLNFNYVFYTTAKDKKGEALMPLIFVADRDYLFSDNDIITLTQAKKYKMITFITVLLIVICASAIAYRIYLKRGKSKEVSVDFAIWPITNTKFMEVVNNKVISYDCWYWHTGQTQQNIYVTGNLNVETRSFAKNLKYLVEYKIIDNDLNEDFSFRPNPLLKAPNGAALVAGQFYPVSVDADGAFNFNINAYLAPELQKPNFDINNILCVKVEIKLSMINGNEKIYINTVEHQYKFIVKPSIQNSNLWVAFDPGTTGSCIAYGASSNPADTNDIFMAQNEIQDISGKHHKTCIFPSKIQINRKAPNIFGSETFTAEQLEEGQENDFLFGNKAEILWNGGINCFQSIKKLLGYTEPQMIKSSKDEIKEISGQDLAHLLVKGLYNHFEEYVRNDDDKETEYLRNMFINQAGEFTPQRAIVAVPNNYTLVKIQEMVDSVKRLGRFKEVHYIYESESVMMSYFRRNWSRLTSLQNKIFVVYDMGGATINTTAFSIKVNTGTSKGTTFIRSIDVKTMAKIGYAIGGDDVDFAIIKAIFGIPSLRANFGSEEEAAAYQRKYKNAYIDLARKIKLDLIEKHCGKTCSAGNVMVDNEKLYGHIKEFVKSRKIVIDNMTDEDDEYITSELQQRNTIRKYVLDNVADAMQELLSSLNSASDVELIMSGRTVLFPGIKETVLSVFHEKGFKCDKPWDGFNDNDGNFDAELVKNAVAVGACWYAMYSNKINLDHKQLTSTFGYIDMVDTVQTFIPVITKKDHFGEDGSISKTVEPKDITLNHLKFVQMLGSNYNEIMTQDIKHKKNLLDEVYASEITSKIENIKLLVDERGNFDYEVEVAGRPESITIKNNPYSRFKQDGVKTEILDENSDAYAFATSNVINETEGEIKSNSSHKSNRF